VVVKISSRKLIAAILEYFGIEKRQLEAVYGVLDKKNKVPQETFEKMLEETIPDSIGRQKVLQFMSVESLEQLEGFAGSDKNANEAIKELKRLFEYLGVMDITEFCRFDIGIVRGLAYYTGIVFEIYDKSSKLRAICGGGRYDNLLADFGGPKIGATGFGMGDCVLGIVLEEKGLFKNLIEENSLEYFVTFAEDSLQNEAIKLIAKLRRASVRADFSYKGGSLSKQLKQAGDCGAARCIIIGREFTQAGQLIIKDMNKGTQQTVQMREFLDRLR
jgi:histidyl-tRNA synthetase